MNKIYLLNNQKFKDIENIEVFKIEYLNPSININDYDALIFTSKNAIYSLLDYNNDWKKIPSYAIAPKTAKIIKNHGGKVEFTGESSHGDDFAKELIPLLKNKKALYIRAQKVVSKLVNILIENNISIDEIITYKTICNNKLNASFENNSVFIFTSPSSVDCFFKNFSWKDSFHAIAIGKTTAKYLPKNIKFTVSEETSIEECIKLAKMVTF